VGSAARGLLLATRFHQQGTQVVVIEQDEDNPWIEVCRKLGMFTLIGDASEPAMLLNAGLRRSRGLFAVCDEDGINADIAMQAKALLNHESQVDKKSLPEARACGNRNRRKGRSISHPDA
jgi:Trk K+ transport system NAD-binding subunit